MPKQNNAVKKLKGQVKKTVQQRNKPRSMSMRKGSVRVYSAKRALPPSVGPIRRSNGAAASYCLPHEMPPVRYAGTFASTPTAVCNPYYLRAQDFTIGATGSPAIPNGQHFVAAFRNTLRALVEHVCNPLNLSATYNAMFYDGGNWSVNCPIRDTASRATVLVDPNYFVDAFPTSSAYAHPHGDVLYVGSHQSRRGFWVDANSTHAAVVQFNFAAGNPIVKAYVLEGDDWSPSDEITATSSTAVFSITSSGYYAFEILPVATMSTLYTLTMICSSDFMGHRPVPYLNTKQASIQAVRTNAVSIMLTCEAAPITASGKVTGLQTPAGVAWTNYLGTGCFNRVASSQGASTRQLINGTYGFLKPSQQRDFDMDTPFTISGGTVVGMDYDLIPQHDYLVIAAETAASGSSTYPGGDCYLTAAWGLEFRTDDVWFVSIPPTLTTEEFNKQVAAIKYLQQWHDNPLHFSDIVNFFKTAGRSVLKYAPSVLSALATVPTPYARHLGIASGIADGLGQLVL